ncbi:MAG TPA: hypothetical protein VGM87_03775, partial [Roseomonas sp.]
MPIARRSLGLGLFGASAAAGAGMEVVRSNPGFRPATSLTGFVGGEKEGLLADPEIVAGLRGAGFALVDRRAGSIEMVRDPALLRQDPAFLWPSSAVVGDIARRGGLTILREQVVLNVPIALFSWDRIADGLVNGGLARQLGPRHYELALDRLLPALLEGRAWSALGVGGQSGRARLLATDPNRSNSGFMFAGLAANVLAGDVASGPLLDRHLPDLTRLFGAMGFKPPSSARVFEDYLAGGPGVQPLVVGYENQLIEWVLADPERWRRVEASAPARPVLIYPRPTVLSAHPVLALKREAVPLIDALMQPLLQERAWTHHGFRGPLGADT